MLDIKTINEDFKDLIYLGDNITTLGNIIFELDGPILDKPTRTSIQIMKGQHIEDSYGQYMNHSCEPNCVIDGKKVINILPIKNGDSLRFNYNDNEDNMASPFECHCCQNRISGKNKNII